MPLFLGIDDLVFRFEKAGFKLYVVGGAVRDCVMGLPPKDYDLATDATPDEVIDLLERSHCWSADLTGKSFGVVRARASQEGDLHEYEIATFRVDVGEGRRPGSVVFTTIEEDVKRRDLTVNALFYDLHAREIVDLVGGLRDIEARVIRTVGRPEDRFREDRLRVLRAIRFAARFGWDIEAGTSRAILVDNNLDGVSHERVRDELVKGLEGAKTVEKFLGDIERFGLWERFLPGLTVNPSVEINVRDVPVLLALLLEGNERGYVRRRLNELKFTNAEISQACFLMQLRELNVDNVYELAKARVRCNVSDDTIVCFVDRGGVVDKDLAGAFLRYHLSVSGDDLIAEGYAGAELGRELVRREVVLFKQLLESSRTT